MGGRLNVERLKRAAPGLYAVLSMLARKHYGRSLGELEEDEVLTIARMVGRGERIAWILKKVFMDCDAAG